MSISLQAVVALGAIATVVAGCASTVPPTRMTTEDVAALAGAWEGWLVTEGGVELVSFDIRADGSFEVRAPRIRASGLLVVTDGRLRFDGTGPWRGSLVPEGTGVARVLRLERDDRLYRGTLRPVGRAG